GEGLARALGSVEVSTGGRRPEILHVEGDDAARWAVTDVPDLAEALAALPGTDAELLRLWAWEQLSPSEIAEVLEITANAASVRLHRAKEKLRAQLDDRLGKKDVPAGHEESREGRQ
ncbi:MAG: sigma-70 family RNA polymerase sigma factor, partial [Actinomycetota bacterium]|nr:sigma-70 family RNA polymerase sigma factor [Actinomycetota bacterium]